jgi:hypothetical protein
MSKERWAFSESELADPGKCSSTDEIVATLPYEFCEENGIEEGVIVYRNGEVSNRFSDGTAGISAEIAELAGECESLYHPDADEETAAWRDVEVDKKGNLVCLLDNMTFQPERTA